MKKIYNKFQTYGNNITYVYCIKSLATSIITSKTCNLTKSESEILLKH